MKKQPNFYQLLFFISLPFLLCYCAQAPVSQQYVNQAIASPYTLPAEAYMDRAKETEGEEKQQALINAAGRLVHEGHWRKAMTILSQTRTLTAPQQSEKQLLLAKIYLMRENPDQALKNLSRVHARDQLALYYQIQYHELLAKAYNLKKNETESVNERIKLENLLPDAPSRDNNRRDIWLSLNKLPKAELNTLALETSDNPELQGWMRLALIPRQSTGDGGAMLSAVKDWQTRFPGHPANKILPEKLNETAQKMYAKPHKVALLLPLTGPFSGPGQAIKDGFLAAAQKNHDALSVETYDTHATPVVALYDEAVREGAEYIVGPLIKSNVAEVAQLHHPVPTVLLNDVEGASSEQAYFFGLSPSAESRQVAAKARKSGHSKALIIAPTGPWGDEVTEAFITQWQDNGGSVIDALRYQNNEDMNLAIKNFLHISQSQNRENALKRIFGKKLEARPRRRQDFDMIFLLAYPKKARQIMPLLKYYYAGDIPVYGTSAVFDGYADTIKDRDLNGIIFCDMPWVFAHQDQKRHAWPEQLNSYNRLYALGMDSYALSQQLNQLLLFPTMGTSDETGILYLDRPQRIARILEWGQFHQGLAKAQEYNV